MYFCKICGRQLEKKGDICIDCYEGLIDEEENQNDTEVVYTLKAQYKLGYELMKSPFTFFLIAMLVVFAIIMSFENHILTGFFNFAIYIGIIILYILLNKIRIESRVIHFYKHKLVYTRKLHFKNRLEVKYRDIEEVQFEDLNKKASILSQSSWWLHKVNKKYKMSDLYFKFKKTEDSFFASGFFIKPIYNFQQEVMPKLMEVMGFVENTEERRSNIEEMLNIKRKDKKTSKSSKSKEKDSKENSKNE